jgi:hypothetical protein
MSSSGTAHPENHFGQVMIDTLEFFPATRFFNRCAKGTDHHGYTEKFLIASQYFQRLYNGTQSDVIHPKWTSYKSNNFVDLWIGEKSLKEFRTNEACSTEYQHTHRYLALLFNTVTTMITNPFRRQT